MTTTGLELPDTQGVLTEAEQEAADEARRTGGEAPDDKPQPSQKLSLVGLETIKPNFSWDFKDGLGQLRTGASQGSVSFKAAD